MDGTRSALIVASDDYADPALRRLRAPASDARALAEVLHDPGIGGFEVRTLLNEPAHMVNLAVEEFFADRRPGDLLLLHFSGHGVKDEDGELYFAVSNTVLGRLGSTAVAAGFVSRRMNRSRSRRVVLLLDCCYAGAFERGLVARAGVEMGIEQQFGGRGRAVITASSAMEYAFEAGELADTQELSPSVFTSALVGGLSTGEADQDQDGLVGLDELYYYVYDKVRAATPNQTPGKWVFGVEGELYIARRSRPVTTPAPLPSELRLAIESPLAGVRAGAVQELAHVLRSSHAGMALAARLALEQLTDDDSRAVAAAATAVLSAPASAAVPGSPPPPTSLLMSGGATGWSGPPVIIEQKVGAALAGREAQREFVASLSERWERLADTWAYLVVSAGDLGACAAGARSADRAETDMFTNLAACLAASADWRERSALVSARIHQCTDLVRTLYRRVHRETVNIGVIGQTGAGKSTLLRKLSGLGEEYIPSNRFSSTTATPSWIFHEPGSGPGRAVLTLHTWESFRDEVLVPLHERARIPGMPPTSVEEFRRFTGYRDDPSEILAGQAGAERYRGRLRWAQDSLPSYQDLLQGGTREISLDWLRPFIAYPGDGDPRSDYRPYHAVRFADVYCRFPEAGVVPLGLVDLPGTGEAGLDVHGRFLTDLRNNVDLLFIVKRPTRAPVTDPDWDVAQLADDAAAGVRRSDFVHQVINHDGEIPNEFFASALARTRADGEQLGIGVWVCDLESSTPAQVAQVILSPVLAILADRLAYMDRDAVGLVLSGLVGITAQLQSLTDELARWIERRQGDLPDEEKRLRARVRELKIEVGAELRRVRDRYDKLDQSGAPIAELHQEIEKVGGEMRQWLAEGLGAGSMEDWLRLFNEAVAVSGMGRELDRQYNNARKQMTAAFRRIDASVHRLVDRLWGEVADALRAKLTEAIVPTGPDNRTTLTAFADTARRVQARTLTEATERLLDLPADYGSTFLRVGSPLIAQITWDREEPESELRKIASGSVDAGGPGIGEASAAAGESAQALRWHRRLSDTTELVITELTQELNTEAQRALRTLVAAVDSFIDTLTTMPGTEIEFERLSRLAQREIWPADFDGSRAEIAADLAALRQRAIETDAATDQVASLADQALRL